MARNPKPAEVTLKARVRHYIGESGWREAEYLHLRDIHLDRLADEQFARILRALYAEGILREIMNDDIGPIDRAFFEAAQ